MKPRISIGVCLILMLVAAFITFQITYSLLTNKYESTVYSFNKYTDITNNLDSVDNTQPDDEWRELYSVLSQADAYVRSNYYGDVDDTAMNDYVISGYLASLGDRYARYYSKEAFTVETESNNGESYGIGVRVAYDTTTGGLFVYEIMENSPASVSGLSDSDIIVAVNGQSVPEIGFEETLDVILSAEEGSEITIGCLTAASGYADEKEFSIIKSRYDIQSVSTRMLDDNVAYVRIHEFNYNTGKEFETRMNAIIAQGADKFVFDVRANPGGIVDGVTETLDYLLPEGAIITVKSKLGEEETTYSDAEHLNAPMVVLIDESTASGGELFAAALRDYEMAALIGTTTYGKGSMQTEFPLSNGGCAVFTTHMYFPPSGEGYDGIGIIPDKVVELTDEQRATFYQLSDTEDSQLQAAVDEVKNR